MSSARIFTTLHVVAISYWKQGRKLVCHSDHGVKATHSHYSSTQDESYSFPGDVFSRRQAQKRVTRERSALTKQDRWVWSSLRLQRK
jgi:hypothetical protein